jgi:hypothetical protein
MCRAIHRTAQLPMSVPRSKLLKPSTEGAPILEKWVSTNLGSMLGITIFCDFRQFSAKKLAFFSKTNVMIKILHNLALF